MAAPSPRSGPWVLRMNWLDLAFLNWRVPADLLAATLPPGAELDLYGGEAWVSIVPFRMTGIAPRFVPDVPGISAFAELNIRTYVRVNGVPGIWFYSLDTSSPLATELARLGFHLPYFRARMEVHRQGDVVRYASIRSDARSQPGSFGAAYRAVGEAYHAPKGSLDEWLTNRLALYSADAQGRLYRGWIKHEPWTLRAAQVVIGRNDLALGLGLEAVRPHLSGEPYALCGGPLNVHAWLLERAR